VKKVELPGHGTFWLHPWDKDEGAPLSHLDECTPKGVLEVPKCFTLGLIQGRIVCRHSYAHVFPNGEIKRYGKVIGRRQDLKEVA
jgi:hypothetical protein